MSETQLPIVLTGVASGIGARTAQVLAERGVSLIGIDPNAPEAFKAWVKEYSPITWNGDGEVKLIPSTNKMFKPFDMLDQDIVLPWETDGRYSVELKLIVNTTLPPLSVMLIEPNGDGSKAGKAPSCVR